MSLKNVLLKLLPHLTGTYKWNPVHLHPQSRCCKINVDEGKESDNLDSLTHWCQDKIATISQSTLSNTFSWMKMLEVGLKFHRSLFLSVQLKIFQHWFSKKLGANQATSRHLNQWWSDYRRIYASLGLNELSTNPVHIRDKTMTMTIGMQIHTLVPKGAHCSAIGRGVLDFCLTVSFNLVEPITLFKRPTRTHESRNSVISLTQA